MSGILSAIRKNDAWLRGIHIPLLGMLLELGMGGCLYTEEIGAPVHSNQEPYFYNWIPSETTVTVGASGATFYAYPTDPDEEDVPLLEMQWYLNGREQGNGNQVKVWLEDLGAEGTGVLAASVVDPYDAQDTLLWRLEAAPVTSDADLGAP